MRDLGDLQRYCHVCFMEGFDNLDDVIFKYYYSIPEKKWYFKSKKLSGLFIFNGELFGEAIDNQDGVVYYWFRKLRKGFKTFELDGLQEKQNGYLFHSNIETYTTSLAPIVYKQIRENM